MPDKKSLHILFTNQQLGEAGGTEINVRDWAIGMSRRGHRCSVYAPVLGETAGHLKSAGIEVVDDLLQLSKAPDIIHATHAPTVVEAIVRFPRVPVFQTCQGIGHVMNEPLLMPQVAAYMPMGEATKNFLLNDCGVTPEKIRLILNAVDLQRIPQRNRPLPEKPQRALIFTKTKAQIPLIEQSCRKTGIQTAQLGRGTGRHLEDVGLELVKFDLVFATARSAMEAIASGVATVVVDARGMAGMATPQNYTYFRANNFGVGCLEEKVSVKSILREINKYNPQSAKSLSDSAREDFDLEKQLDQIEAAYEDILKTYSPEKISHEEFFNRLQPVLHRWLPRYPGTDWPWQYEKAGLLQKISDIDEELGWERAAPKNLAIKTLRKFFIYFLRRLRYRLR
ncbi:MAG: glycosyltransferase [Pseudomonadota bacterium]